MKDLTGKKFGRWTVLYRDEDHITTGGKHLTAWVCQCSCGKHTIKTITGQALKSGSSKSCGCLFKESRKELGKYNKKENAYDLSKNYGIGYTKDEKEFYFDLEDYEKIKKYCWVVANNGYVVARDCDSNCLVSMHMIIMNSKELKSPVDHINHNTQDNRKENLRICTNSENMYNAVLRSDNTSGCKGVSWNKQHSKWEAYINYNKKRIRLGLFSNKEDAIKARKNAEEKYHGEFSYKGNNVIVNNL